MFTGIVEEIGTVRTLRRGAHSAVLSIDARTVLERTRLGDSIAVNGVCLTVTSLGATQFSADVMHETLRRSNLGALHAGSPVNLERAMAADGRFGGHLVSGTSTRWARFAASSATTTPCGTPSEPMRPTLRHIIMKGSIAIDGVSLTVAAPDRRRLRRVHHPPHPGPETTLSLKRVGDEVNLETDMVGKYVERFLGAPLPPPSATAESGGITQAFLTAHGF